MNVPRRLVAVLIAVGATALSASLYPLDPDAQEDVAGARHLPPLTSAHAISLNDQRTLIVRDLKPAPGGYSGRRADRTIRIESEQLLGVPEARFYLLGTDRLGRDLTSRLLVATRRSLWIGGLSVLVALSLGTLVGLSAVVGGRRVDAILMRCVDIFLAVPRLLLLLVSVTLLPPSTTATVLLLGGLTWPGLARLVRAEALRLRKAEFTSAAQAIGCSPARIAARHWIPQLEGLILVTAALRLADTLVLESALSFLGYGSASASLGSIIESGRHTMQEAWWVVLFPALVLSGAVMIVQIWVRDLRARFESRSVA